jgi:hypothetical protein
MFPNTGYGKRSAGDQKLSNSPGDTINSTQLALTNRHTQTLGQPFSIYHQQT